MGSIGILPGATTSTPTAISPDGSIVVGYSDTPGTGTEGQAFRWTTRGGMIGLGFMPGGSASEAFALSADGSVVVGEGSSGLIPGRIAMIWDAQHGMRPLQQVFTVDYGLNMTGWVLGEANAVSADGNIIVGQGIDSGGNFEAWIATIPEPGTGLLVMGGLLGLAVARRRRV